MNIKSTLFIAAAFSIWNTTAAQDSLIQTLKLDTVYVAKQFYNSKIDAVNQFAYGSNFANQLSVNTTGIHVATSGLPGVNPNLVVNGFNNIYAEQQPNLVVDGVLYNGSWNNINPYIIEELKVISNPFESSLPLSLTTNGVIEISTKKSHLDRKWHFNFNTNAGIINKVNSKYEIVDKLSELLGIYYTAQRMAAYGMGVSWEDTKSNFWQYLDFENNQYPLNIPQAELFDPITGNVKPEVALKYDDKPYEKIYVKNGFRNQQDFSASKSFNKGFIQVNLGHLNEQTTIRNNAFNRLDGGIIGAWSPTKKLQLGLGLQIANTKIDGLTNEYNMDQKYNEIVGYYNIDSNGIQNSTKKSWVKRFEKLNSSKTNASFFNFSPNIKYDLAKNLSLHINLGYNKEVQNTTRDYLQSGQNLVDGAYTQTYNMQTTSLNPKLIWSGAQNKHQWFAVVQAHKNVTKHEYNISFIEPNRNSTSHHPIQKDNFIADANLSYSFNNIFGLNFRGSNESIKEEYYKYQSDHNRGWQYAAGAHFNLLNTISNTNKLAIYADFTKRDDFNNLTNDRLLAFQSTLTHVTFDPFTFSNQAAKHTNTTVGLKAKLNKDRIFVDVSLYQKKIIDAPIWNINYLYLYRDNCNIDNGGINLSSQINIIKSKNWNWQNTFTLSHNKSTIERASPNLYIYYGNGVYSLMEDGVALNNFVLPHWAGVNPENGLSLFYKKDGSITSDYHDLEYSDYKAFNLDPIAFGSFTNRVNWKNLELGISVNYSLGGKVYDNQYAVLMSGALGTVARNAHKDLLNAWTPDNKNTSIPANTFSDNNYVMSSFYLINASWLRIKNVSLTYNVPPKKLGGDIIKGCSVYFAGDNLLFSSHRKGLNPNNSNNGYNLPIYASFRTMLLGVNLNF